MLTATQCTMPTKERQKAREAVILAIRRGALPKAETLYCAYCGEKAHEYHHHLGYDEMCWLAVIPLCKPCHDSTLRMPRIYRHRWTKTEERARQLRSPIVNRLVKIQENFNLDDHAFAERLGVCASRWKQIRNVRCLPKRPFLIKALTAFPELEDCISLDSVVELVGLSDQLKGSVIEALVHKQSELLMTVHQFAAELGISVSTWINVKKGKKSMRLKMVKGICRRFPELAVRALSEFK